MSRLYRDGSVLYADADRDVAELHGATGDSLVERTLRGDGFINVGN